MSTTVAYAANDFPKAKAPVAPVVSLASIAWLPGSKPPASILDAGQLLYTTSGRTAIAQALKLMGVGKGDSVLVPAYHCPAMIEPVVWLGATPVFYCIGQDASVDLADLDRKLDASCKVLLAANYFGFPQDLTALRRFCDARGLMFLEDCAHCMLGEHAGMPVGSFGDYAIASTMKFFPIYEGGALASFRHGLDGVQLQSAGKGFEAKMAINALEESFAYRRLPLLRLLMWAPMALKDALWSRMKARGAAPANTAPSSSEGGYGFDPQWLNKRSSLFSRAMMRLTSRKRMGERRRHNYLRLEAALREVPGWEPLFSKLPDGAYPWVFPIVVRERSNEVFCALKQAGVPIIRFAEFPWEGMPEAVCANSHFLSKHSMQFPVHQELRDDELDWMIDHITSTLKRHLAP